MKTPTRLDHEQEDLLRELAERGARTADRQRQAAPEVRVLWQTSRHIPDPGSTRGSSPISSCSSSLAESATTVWSWATWSSNQGDKDARGHRTQAERRGGGCCWFDGAGALVEAVGLDREACSRSLSAPSAPAAPFAEVVVVQALPRRLRGELAVKVLTQIRVAPVPSVGRRAQRHGLEGRTPANWLALDRARGRRAGRGGHRRSPSTTLARTPTWSTASRRRPRRRACAGGRIPTSVPARAPWSSSSVRSGLTERRGVGVRRAGAVSVPLGAEVFRLNDRVAASPHCSVRWRSRSTKPLGAQGVDLAGSFRYRSRFTPASPQPALAPRRLPVMRS